VLDELNSSEGDIPKAFKAYLNTIERLALHWGLVKSDRYGHRLVDYGLLDIYINELPRSTNMGKLFCVKTFVLSCKTPYMKLKDGAKIFISKEYSHAAGKLHLSFYQLHATISKQITAKIESLTEEAEQNLSRANLVDFFKTIFSTDD
jgi:hypothetical protein